jgi:glycosyltransferase involved in cell wall biosynthesis
LQAEPGRTLLVGENATALAEQIISLIEQPELCQRLGQAGRAYVEANHSWVGIARQLAEVYGRVV